MNEYVKNVAKEAGFVLWDDEDINPRNYVVDWSTIYDEQLEKFAKIIAKDVALDCAYIAGFCQGSSTTASEISKVIRNKYGV